MDVQWSTVNGLVAKGTTVSDSSPTVDHCRLQMNSQWSTTENVMTVGTTVSDSSHTVDHCRLLRNAQWSTVDHLKVLGTTLTCVTVYSKLLQMQNGCAVVYFEWCSDKGDYCE